MLSGLSRRRFSEIRDAQVAEALVLASCKDVDGQCASQISSKFAPEMREH